MIDFDENWYLATNPDLAEIAGKDKLFDPVNHYINFGIKEGRAPKPPQGAYQNIYSYGAYGSNNVGDEAILDGVRFFYPNCKQLYLFKPRDGNSVEYNLPLKSSFFKKNDYLIIGGGGLLYSKEVLKYMLELTKKAISEGAIVDVLRIGCEAANEEFYREIYELHDLVRFFSVRSSISAEIIKKITGKDVVVQKDFAFCLKKLLDSKQKINNVIPRIGIVLGSIDIDSIQYLGSVISKFLIDTSFQKVKFFFLPHSRSFFDVNNNDCATFERLWTSLVDAHKYSDSPIELIPFTSKPLEMLKIYSSLDGIISDRYHGLIFSKINNLPTIALGSNSIKTRSFILDNLSSDLYQCPQLSELENILKIFINNINSNSKGKSK
jgi:polysaccharide pyruvyl transferase WcaK-like protein